MSTTPLRVLHEQGRSLLRTGNLPQALQVLREAASKTSARESDYLPVMHDLRQVLWELRRYREALTVDWYIGDRRSQQSLLNHVPDVDRARTVRAWADSLAGDEAQAVQHYHQAADIYEQAGLIAQSAICRERSHDFGTAKALWSRLAQALSRSEADRYAAGLARFNLARSCQQTGNEPAARAAFVAAVHLLEEAADRYEQIGQRERAFDCYQVLIAIGKQSAEFEHVLEGYVNVVRILREDHLRYYALQSYEEALAVAQQHEEYSAGATLAQEMAAYAESQAMTAVANHGARAQADMWQRVAQAAIIRQAPPEIAENALLAAVVSLARQGQFRDVGRLYRALGELDLEPGRKQHYARASQRYEQVENYAVEASPLPSHLRQDAAYPEVWHVDLVEWEQQGSASAACGDVVLEAQSWSEITRRRAMLARLCALEVEATAGQPPDGAFIKLAELLGQVELYGILAPLEKLYESPRAEIRLAVIRALERFMYKRTFVTVRAALSDPDGPVQEQACRTVEALRFPHAFDPLARIFREQDDSGARTAALRAIARIDTTEAAELLLGVFQHEGPREREAAAAALKQARGTAFLNVARSAKGTLSDATKNMIREVFQVRGELL